MNLQKNKPYRNRKLLNLAHRVNECMFKSPVCEGISTRGCEAAHSDFQEHGKGMGQKASDDKVCACCKSCHNWIGEKRVPREVLLGMFERGIDRTMGYYRKMKWLSKIGYPEKGD
jgi:hypothetical protein